MKFTFVYFLYLNWFGHCKLFSYGELALGSLWIPAYSDIEGNEQVIALAEQAHSLC